MTTISGHTTRANGTILTAAIYNADHVNHVTNAQALNATKMEGATPPVADGHAVVWNGTSGNALRTAGFAPVSATVYAADQASNSAALALKAPIASPTFTGVVTIPGGSLMKAQGGAEGGELDFEKPPTGSTLVGNMAVDVSGNRFRVSDTGTPFKGAFLDLTTLGNGVSSKFLTDVDFSDQATAEAGADNAHVMTPLRTAQAIAALAQALNVGALLSVTSGGVDTGIDDVKGGALLIGLNASTSMQISCDGGTNYTALLSSGNGPAILFIKGGVVAVMSVVVGVTRLTPTTGTGNVFLKTGSLTVSAIRVM